jgi:hypothetical protein
MAQTTSKRVRSKTVGVSFPRLCQDVETPSPSFFKGASLPDDGKDVNITRNHTTAAGGCQGLFLCPRKV